jgi:hypothetical protein
MYRLFNQESRKAFCPDGWCWVCLPSGKKAREKYGVCGHNLTPSLRGMNLQYCSSKGYISVHWQNIENNWRGGMDVDGDGKVTRRDLKSKWNTLTGFLTQNIQFKSSFMIGLYAGIRYG